ncbi:MAG TPA: hypothetical protein ENK83_04225 [Aliiroseovarius sp.]|nr:hypothetical protein [Aliiroseovarius sp.]
MSLLDDVADRLATKTLDVLDATGDDAIVDEIVKVIGASSTTLEEAYKTAVRVRRAERRALEMLARFEPNGTG